MREIRFALAATAAAASIGLIAGCSNGGSAVPQSVIPSKNAPSVVRQHDGTGVAPRFLGMLRFGAHAPRPNPNVAAPPLRLAVSDFGTGAVEFLGSSYQYKRSITSGISGPDGNWIDGSGRFYNANYAGPNVTEYFAHGSVPIFTYSANLDDPVDVTTDELNSVYIADYNSGGTGGFVEEFPQMSNTPAYICQVGGAAEGVAVGENGQVFVSYNDPNTGVGHLAEYVKGLAGCKEKVLPITLGFAGGLQVANNRALVAIDQFAGVDIIPSPYTAISSTINPGYGDPFHLALTKSNGLLYVADPSSAVVWVQTYPGGSVLTSLGSSNGLSDPSGVATFPFVH